MEKKNSYIKNLVERMSIEQKIGAVLTLGFAGTVPRAHIYKYIEEYHCGGLRLSCDSRQFGSYVDPNGDRTVVELKNNDGIRFRGSAPVPAAGQYKAVLDDLQEHARRRPLSIPLHFSYDQEGGSSADFFFGGVNLFAKPMGIRAMDDPDMAYKIARAVAKQSKAVGFNWVHSPVLDVNSEPANPEIYTRAYSDDAGEVALYAGETCRGFLEEKMIATGKHFPGRGHSDVDAHFKVPVIDADEKTLWERELLPYRRLIERGLLPSIMIAHSIFPALDPEHIATVSEKIVTGLLREKLGFQGVITTDSMTMGAIATRYGVANACALALEAGADLVLMKAENHLVEDVIAAIRAFLEQGRISMEEMNRKVYRVLKLKYEYGLFGPSQNTEAPEKVLQDASIRELARQAARRSVLIERCEKGALPAGSGPVAVIEQKVKEYNDMQWHSGILYEECLKYNRAAVYLETSYSYDETDQKQIAQVLETYDTVIATNYFLRGKAGNKAFWKEQLEKYPDTRIIFVTNTPYEEISVPENAGNVLVTFATSPENIRAAAAVLFGRMMPEGVWPLRYRKPGGNREKDKKKEFLVCIDSDGCAMDTMTIKHSRCFGPCLAEVWKPDGEREELMRRWNEINLYSATRGINRFKGLVLILEELREKGFETEGLDALKQWTENAGELSNASLKEALSGMEDTGTGTVAFRKALKWSLMVNERIAGLGKEEKKPFAEVAEALSKLHGQADIAIVSAANEEAVKQEWAENGLLEMTDYVFAQNHGTKEECLKKLRKLGYSPEKILMVGDAPGDMQAAEKNGVSFYPIVPGDEAQSWKELSKEGFHRFLSREDWNTYEREKKERYFRALCGGNEICADR